MRAWPAVLLSILLVSGVAFGQTSGVGDNQLTEAEEQAGFELLFNGENLEGWEGDKAIWQAREGMIVGRSEAALAQNSHLVLPGGSRGDFVLRLAFQINAGQAGLAWRAQAIPEAGEAVGYSGAVAADDPALRQGMWNHVELACQGDRLVARLNGVTLADAQDDQYRQGGIGLLLAGGAPAEAYFKNVRIKRLKGEDPIPEAQSGVPPGWTGLFTGEDIDDFVVMGKQEGFQITEEGVLHSDSGKGGNWLRSKKQYSDFVFHVEWKVAPNGNSGAFIRSKQEGAPWVTGHEIQITNAPRDDLHCTGTLYGNVAANPRPDESPNVWHSFDIHCVGPLITVIVDGKRTLNVNQEEVEKIKNKPLVGYVGVQDSHGAGWIEYRNIWIKELVPGNE